ncbi:chromosomal replication initiator protein DnaA [Rhodobaculum claviforme]|nr:chromosomal replication initiator protein DnaA [Rhodobaculum claviforme]
MWTEACTGLRDRIGRNNFVTWIEPLQLRGVTDGVLRFSVPTRFLGDWVVRHFAEAIVQECVRAGAQVTRLDVALARPRTDADGAPMARATPAPRAGTGDGPGAQVDIGPDTPPEAEADLPSGPLDPRFTFDNFVVGKPNELAHAAARRVAEGGAITFNPLFLYGGVGLGKTHLMHAIAWELRRQQPGLRVLYVSAEQFMYRFVDALRNKQIMDFKQLFRSVDVLMVDDVQFIAGKESTQEEFFHTFNALVDQRKQIVISADRAPGEIKDLEDRITSRLQWGLVVDLHPTDYELRLGILQTKLEAFRAQDPNVVVAPDVLEFLAHKITTNVRVLEGALTRLHAFASLVGREITLELAQDCLADILRVSERRVTIEEIQRKVAEHYNIRLSDMIGPKRVRTLARPRQVAMYLSKELTAKSLPDIGRRFGGRDHTTIIHGVRKVEELVAADPQLAEDLRLLRRLLSS